MDRARLAELQAEMRNRWNREIVPGLRRQPKKVVRTAEVRLLRGPTSEELMWSAELAEYAAIVLMNTTWERVGSEFMRRVVEMRGIAQSLRERG